MTFSVLGSLFKHVKLIHDKVKPLRCKFCEKIFVQLNGLTLHTNKVHSNLLTIKDRHCDKCDITFKDCSSLNRHSYNAHKSDRKKTLSILPKRIF